MISNNRVLITKFSLISGFISAMFGSLLAQHYLWDDAYYHLMDLSFIFYLYAFYLLSKKDSKEFCKLWKAITLIILLCSVSTLVDELFYNAKEVEWNDLIRITLIVFASFSLTYKRHLWKVL